MILPLLKWIIILRKHVLKYALFIALCALSLTSLAQSTLQLVYGGSQDDWASMAIQKEDDGYFVLGRTYSYGEGDADILISSIDSTGNLLWSKILGTNIRDIGYTMKKDLNGDYIILNWVNNSAPSYDDWYIVKMNEEGDILQEKFFGGGHDDEVQNVEITADGGYLFAGGSWSYGTTYSDLYLIKTDQSLEVQWTKIYDSGLGEHSRCIRETDSGQYIFVGNRTEPGNYGQDIEFIYFDNLGNIIWSKKIGSALFDEARSLTITEDGNFIVVGHTENYGANAKDILIFKGDPYGNILWAKILGGSGDEKAWSIISNPGGDHLISGTTTSFGNGNEDFILLRIDDDGELLNANTIGGDHEELNPFLSIANDSGYIVSGGTRSFGSGGLDMFVIKTDLAGNSCCSEEITGIMSQNINLNSSDLSFTSGNGMNNPSHTIVTNFITPPSEVLCFSGIQIMGNDTVCSGNIPFVYYITPNPTINLQWSVPTGSVISSTQGDSLIYVLFGSQSGYIYVSSVDGCNPGVLDSLFVTVADINPPDLGNDTTLCSSDSLILNAGQGYISYLWQDGSTDSTYLAKQPGIYWVEVENNYGCIARDSIILVLGDIYPDLGNDSTFCEGDSIILSPGSYYEYLWQDGSTGQFITAVAGGLYWVEVWDEFGCSGMDSVYLQMIEMPDPDLGNDTTICIEDWLLLDPGSGALHYLWQDGSTDSVYNAGEAGIYWVEMTNSCGSKRDSLLLSTFPSPSIDLGPDTSFCYGNSIILNAGSGYLSYLWNDGSIDSTLEVFQTGFYSVDVTDSNSCNGTDSVHVTANVDFEISIGNDTTICYGDSMILDAGAGYMSYLWQDGDTNQYTTASAEGYYWVEVTRIDGCASTDSLLLEITPEVLPFIGNDTTICLGEGVILTPGPYYSEYLWQDGSREQFFIADTNGTYWVEVWNEIGCNGFDSIHISTRNTLQPEIQDQNICYGEEAIFEADSGYTGYLWSDSSILTYYITQTQGIHWLMVSDQCGYAIDTFTLTVYPELVPDIGNDTSICVGDLIYMDAGNEYSSFEWQDGYDKQVYEVSEPGVYWVMVSNGKCFGSDTIFIDDCPDLIIPNVFTPNSDGFNDTFFAKGSGIQKFHLQIFNRWGQFLFEADDINQHWDGKYKGQDCSDGTYFWTIDYEQSSYKGIRQHSVQGSVTLLR